jgi:hypothetical protein
MIQTKIINKNNELNYVNRLNLFYRLNEVPYLLGVSDKTSRRLVKIIKQEDDRKGNGLISKTNGVWNIHFSLLDRFIANLSYKLNADKLTLLSTPWKSFLTINIKGGYTKEYYLELFKLLRRQIELKCGENNYFPAIERNPNNEYYHFHLLSTLPCEDMVNRMEPLMVELLASDSQNNVKNEYQYLCEEPKSNAKLVHYLYKGNAITDDDYEYILDMEPPTKLRFWN